MLTTSPGSLSIPSQPAAAANAAHGGLTDTANPDGGPPALDHAVCALNPAERRKGKTVIRVCA